MEETFKNAEIDIQKLPNFKEVKLNPVSLKLRTKSLVQTAALMILIFGGIGAFLVLNGPDLLIFIAAGVLTVFFAIRITDIILKQKFYGYALREKDIIFRQGYISTQTTIIPFNRIQHSSVNRSFFDKLFGISSLKIYTAGGSGSDMAIPGLTPERAQNLNSAISENISKDE